MPRFNEPLTMTPEQFDRLDGRLSQVVDLLGLLIAVTPAGHLSLSNQERIAAQASRVLDRIPAK